MRTETIVLNERRNVTLHACLQEEGSGQPLPAVLVLPGGGYQVCADAEAEPPAFAYQEAGFQAFVLRYTVGRQCEWPLPLQDYEQAMEVIRSNAGQWNIDPDKIAVAGFSAGGHLAACAATVSKVRPAAAVLVYPAILKECMDDCLIGVPCPDQEITDSTCPCFFAAARDDDMVDIRNSLKMQLALADHNIPFESHIYSVGGHAFGTAQSSPFGHAMTPRLGNWVKESIGWLKETLL